MFDFVAGCCYLASVDHWLGFADSIAEDLDEQFTVSVDVVVVVNVNVDVDIVLVDTIF